MEPRPVYLHGQSVPPPLSPYARAQVELPADSRAMQLWQVWCTWNPWQALAICKVVATIEAENERLRAMVKENQ